MAKKRKQLISIDEAKPCATQHTKPCQDCPVARTALRGWLGGGTVEEWLKDLHNDVRLDCHTLIGPQCAGAAIYRRNVCKRLADPTLLLLPADREKVFATPMEFKAHHERTG